MGKVTKSIIQDKKECFICGCSQEELLSEHHIIEGHGRRDLSEKFGLKIWICYHCHSLIHDDNENELELKQLAQRTFEEKIGSREEWIKYFWKSYL